MAFTTSLSISISALWEGARAFSSSQNAVNSLRASLSELEAKKLTLTADTKSFNLATKQIEATEKALLKIEDNNQKIAQNQQKRAEFQANMMGTIAKGMMAIAPIKLAVDYETALVGIQKVVDFSSEAEFKKMGSDILEMSTRLPVASTGLAQIASAMGGIGLAKKDILGATEAVAIMSTAFDMSAESAGDSMGKLMNVYGLSVKEVLAVGDTINAVDAGTAAKAKLTVEVLGRIGGASKAMGISASSAAGLAGAFLDLGVAPEVAGTGINALLSKMMTADKQGDKFQNGLKAIGMSASQMKNAIAKDGIGAVNGLMNSLAKLPNAEKMGVLVDLFGTEYTDDIALVVGGIDRYNTAVGIASNTTKNAGSMREEFNKQQKTTANQLELLKNSTLSIGITLGSVLLPVVVSLTGAFKGGADMVGALAKEYPNVTTAVGGLVVGVLALSTVMAVGGYLYTFVAGGLATLSSMYTLVSLGVTRLAIAQKLATAGQWLLNVAMSMNPIGLIVVGVTALIGLGVALYNSFKPFTDLVNSVGSSISAMFGFGDVKPTIKAPVMPQPGGIPKVGGGVPTLPQTGNIANKGGGINTTNINMSGITVRNEADIKKIAEAVTREQNKANKDKADRSYK